MTSNSVVRNDRPKASASPRLRRLTALAEAAGQVEGERHYAFDRLARVAHYVER